MADDDGNGLDDHRSKKKKKKKKKNERDYLVYEHNQDRLGGNTKERGKTLKMLMIDESFSATNKSAQTLSQCLLRTLNGPKTN
jgi:hypothetical protein